ncbi:unnamed protein product [Rotaria magnacalcarata]|uniref:GTP-binding nuclear protein n=1 Tax=Rotaria magnacalcarata TaxID=392030 RepID=A0A815Y8Y2_9BILA|nr:unnamed protein product [Rotaria magnacalcarata]
MAINQNNVLEFKLILIGDFGVGKTTFVKRYLTYDIENECLYRKSSPAYQLKFYTNSGEIIFNVSDTLGQERLRGIRDSYYIGGQCAIIMFDLTSRVTYRNVPMWYADLARVCDNIPIVLCGNKADLKDRKLKAKSMIFHRKKNIQYYEISALSNYNLEKPFLWLAKKLTENDTLLFTSAVILRSPERDMDPELIQKYENELLQAASCSLLDDDDDDDEI